VAWEPRQSDIEWVQELLRVLTDGGTWAVPCSASIFTFYHSKKEYVLLGERDDMTNAKTIIILERLGWKERKNEE
jgi:hypothetical protein